MIPNPEKLVGIAVNAKLSPDASLVMHGWLNGRRWSVHDPKRTTLQFDSSPKAMFYWDPNHNFTKEELNALNRYLEPYFEKDDPKPYLCDMVRSKAYFYTGKHKEES